MNTIPSSPEIPKLKALDIPFDEIQDSVVEWLWEGYIPAAKNTVLAGEPGLGKSTFLLDIAARITTSGSMPDETNGMLGPVIIMSAEDDPEDTIKPRLKAAGANLTEVFFLNEYQGAKGKKELLQIPNHLSLIEETVQKRMAALLIIDPLSAFLAGIDDHRNNEVRGVLAKLNNLARNNHCAVVCMTHLNKGTGGKAIHRSMGSLAYIANARSGLIVGEDPDDREKFRVLAVSKANLSIKKPSLRFQLVPEGNVCKIGWTGVSPYTADQLIAHPDELEQKETKKNQEDLAAEWLLAYLEDGEADAEQIIKAASKDGIPRATLYRARAKKKDLIEATKTKPAKWKLKAA